MDQIHEIELALYYYERDLNTIEATIDNIDYINVNTGEREALVKLKADTKLTFNGYTLRRAVTILDEYLVTGLLPNERFILKKHDYTVIESDDINDIISAIDFNNN